MGRHKKKLRRKLRHIAPVQTVAPASVMRIPSRYSPMRGTNYSTVDDVPNPSEDLTAREYDDGVLTIGVWRRNGQRDFEDWEGCDHASILLFLEGS